MKHLLCLCCLVIQFTVAIPLYSQSNGPQSESYFPLQTGNYWAYQVHVSEPGIDTTFVRTLRVIGDTLLPNGKEYFVIDSLPYDHPAPTFFREDTLVNKIFEYAEFSNGTCQDSERVVFDLNFPSICSCFLFCDPSGLGDGIVYMSADYNQVGYLNHNVQELEYSWEIGAFSYNFRLYKGFGIGFYLQNVFGGETARLIEAQINGQVYRAAPTSVSPISDRNVALFLAQNYPNPFNPTTQIDYTLSEATSVSLKIYNLIGQEVRTLVNTNQPEGSQSVEWDGRDNNGNALTSGIYIYRLKAGASIQTKHMTLMK